MIKATHKITGELIELNANNATEVINAWRIATEYEKLGEALKAQLKKLLPNYLDESGKTDEVDGYRFTSIFVQRRNYDKAVMRQVFDEDTFDIFLKPDKTLVDNYIKEHLNELGEASSKLRETMIDDGKGYSATKLVKVS